MWGAALALLLRICGRRNRPFGFLFGALVLTVVGFTLVAALKGLPSFAGGNKQVWWRVGC